MRETLKMFPMLDGPPIAWDTAEIIYQAYSAIYGTNQSIGRMAERGGFGWGEVEDIMKEYRRQKGDRAYRSLCGK